jgi:tRNA (mo5U34)-methyltransferase
VNDLPGARQSSHKALSRHPGQQDRVRQRIRELGPWFHNMELCGLMTAPDHFLGDYPRCKWERFAHALPRNLTGKTVLDIGCNAGFHAIEMKRRGAERVLAIDTEERYLAQARLAAELLGADIEFRQLSVYDVAAIDETFDVVLFMGVLYHLRYPLFALDLLRQHVVGDLLVFQTMLRGADHVAPVARDYPFAETEIFERPGHPGMYFVEHCYAGDPTNWWIPNRAGAEAMLRSAGFEILERPETEVFLCRPATGPDTRP